MGYYTDYYLNAAPVSEEQYNSISAFLKELRDVEEECFEDGAGYWKNIQDTWYQSFDDMVSISKQFPEVLFTLTGYGDQRDDQWIEYFKNGRVQHCSVYSLEVPLRPHRWSSVEKDEHGSYRPTLQLTDEEQMHDSLQLDVYQCICSISGTHIPFDPDQLDRMARAIAAYMESENLTVKKPALFDLQSAVKEFANEE